ncbi:MAG: hypothetical protein PHD76_00360 [Methylacidiphilales bacterium]|nr:hypothetical protein [Candidatus Methylacidiphilales bacterium]
MKIHPLVFSFMGGRKKAGDKQALAKPLQNKEVPFQNEFSIQAVLLVARILSSRHFAPPFD